MFSEYTNVGMSGPQERVQGPSWQSQGFAHDPADLSAWQFIGGDVPMASQNGDGIQTNWNAGTLSGHLDEQQWRAAGYTGPLSGGEQDPPELIQWMTENGIKLGMTQNDSGQSTRMLFQNGQPIGTPNNFATDADNEFAIAAIAAGGVMGAAAGGAFTAGSVVGSAGGTGGGSAVGTVGGGYAGMAPAIEAAGGVGAGTAAGGYAGSAAAAEGAALGGFTGGYEAAGLAGAAGGGGGLVAGGIGGTVGAAASWIPGVSNGQVVGVGANLLGGYLSSNAAGKAADTQAASAREANDLLRYMYDTTRTDNLPALDARNAGIGGYRNLLANPGSITQDPGYQFGLQQGQGAIDRSAASRGGLFSGQTLKASQRFGQDYAGSKFDNALNRYGNLAGMGQVGAGTIANAGSNYGNQASQNITGAGNARASGYVGQANAWNNALSGGYNAWQDQEMMDLYRRRGY